MHPVHPTLMGTPNPGLQLRRKPGPFDLPSWKPQQHLWWAGQGWGLGRAPEAAGPAWLRPKSPGFKDVLQRQVCVPVASFVPAQGRQTSQCLLLPRDGSSDPRRYSLPPSRPNTVSVTSPSAGFCLIKAAMKELIRVSPALAHLWPGHPGGYGDKQRQGWGLRRKAGQEL